MKLQMSTLLLALSLLFTRDALAIDSVTLTSGEVIEGKVLNEVPNRYVDFELMNGTKKRFQKTEVSNVDRDIPSSKDTTLYGSDSRMYFGVLGGLSLYNISGTSGNTYTQFNYGARFGVNASQIGNFGKLAFGLSVDRFSVGVNQPLLTTISYTSIMAQVLIRKVVNSGFYFGPEVGLGIATSSLNTVIGSASTSSSVLALGLLAGYDYYASPGFSFGPEAHYDSFASSSTTLKASALKFLLSLTFHFE